MKDSRRANNSMGQSFTGPPETSRGSPTQSLNNIQKISARLRARNPVVMSMNTSPQMLLPLNQRNSPTSYNQLASSQEQQPRGQMHPTPLSINSSNFTTGQTMSQIPKTGQLQKLTTVSSGPTPTNQAAMSRDINAQRKFLHKSMIGNSGPQKHTGMDSSMIQIDQRGHQKLSQESRSNGPLNMSAHLITQRNQTGAADMSGVNIGGNSILQSSERQMHPLESGNQVALKPKFSGQRKRNTREKSYDLYTQKLQLPPMIKPGSSDLNTSGMSAPKTERTYSLQTTSQVNQSMNMSPNAMTQLASPKYNTVQQRQSISEVLKAQVSNGPQQQTRFAYQSLSITNQMQVQIDPNDQPLMPPTKLKTPQNNNGSQNLNTMKGFFNNRNQQPPTTRNQTEIQKPSISSQQDRSNGFQSSNPTQGIVSPRRVMPQTQMQAPTVRQSHQRQDSSHGKTGLHMKQAEASPPRAKKFSGGGVDLRDEMLARPPNPLSSSADSTASGKSGSFNSNFDDDSNGKKSALSESASQTGEPNIQFVEVQTLLFGENPPVLNPKTIYLKNHEPTKASQKKCGHIKSYAANTNQGIIREYNEDRVSIILNILKPKSKANSNLEWPQICFFGVFDGHGGAACADYLRDNLHNFVVQNEHFPQFPQEAIMAGFKECERSFCNLVEVAQSRAQHAMPGQQVGPERSGSCACVVIIINDTAYVVNVGDSRCIMSLDSGANIAVCSRDHKPDDEQERIRIQAAGGKVYRTQTFAKAATNPDEKDLYVQGPLRVFPGRLSVSRTFGDIEAKRAKYGGNANVIVCEPEIKMFKLKDNFDFFLIGCDGIFERLDNKAVIDAVWDRIQDQINTKTYDQISPQGGLNKFSKKYQSQQRGNSQQQFHYDEHTAAAEGVEIVLREAAASRSLDNITVVILGLKNLKRSIKKLFGGLTIQQVRQQNLQEQRGVKHTYSQDFEYLEVNEQDLQLLSDPEVASVNSHGADATAVIETDNKRKKMESASPKGLPARTHPKLNSDSLAGTSRKLM